MKLGFLAAAVVLMSSGNVRADVLGVTAGVEMWQADPSLTLGDTGFSQLLNAEDQSSTAFYVAFEHPLPLLPNIALRRQQLDFTGITPLAAPVQIGGTSFAKDEVLNNQFALEYNDATLYYELLDNDLARLDVGVTARFVSADIDAVSGAKNARAELSVPLPMLYWNASVSVLGTAASVFFAGNYVSYSDNSFYDAKAGLAYELIDAKIISLSVKLGVQKMDLEVIDQDDIDAMVQVDGAFLALEADF